MRIWKILQNYQISPHTCDQRHITNTTLVIILNVLGFIYTMTRTGLKLLLKGVDLIY
jgi:hypothetical protein